MGGYWENIYVMYAQLIVELLLAPCCFLAISVNIKMFGMSMSVFLLDKWGGTGNAQATKGISKSPSDIMGQFGGRGGKYYPFKTVWAMGNAVQESVGIPCSLPTL